MTDREWIEHHFSGRLGRFLEIGAYTGVRSSLTVGLIKAGWCGVLIEPNPSCFTALNRNHGDNKRLTLVHAAVSDKTGLSLFWDDEGGEVSTLSAEHALTFKRNADTPYTSYMLMAIDAVELLNYFGGPRSWDLVVIDAEGVSSRILKALPLAEMLDTEVIVVEWDSGNDQAVTNIMRPYYDSVRSVPPNTIAVRRRS